MLPCSASKRTFLKQRHDWPLASGHVAISGQADLITPGALKQMVSIHSLGNPLIEFFQMIPSNAPPRRADKSVGGVIPARALRYCEAVTSASAFGWYVFLPMSFKVVWDGHDMLWTYPGIDEWLPLTRDAVQYPGFSQQFDRFAPCEVRGFCPPFLAPSIQPGQLQIWTGCIAKTAPGWSLLVRGVANLPHSQSYQVLEGIIETDSWFGPLFDNVRILKTDVPIDFRSDIPFLQVQPVSKEIYAGQFLQNFAVKDIEQLSPGDWKAFHATVVVPNTSQERQRGQYAVRARKHAGQTVPIPRGPSTRREIDATSAQ